MEIKIRNAVRTDIDSIYSCIRGLAEHVNQLELFTVNKSDLSIALFDNNNSTNIILAENNIGDTLGYALYFQTFSTFKGNTNLFIEDLFVYPEYRTNGIGTKLIQHIIEEGKNQSSGKVEWYVNNKNKKAIEFYQKMGARELDYKSIFYMECE